MRAISRLVVSQNARQRNSAQRKYSYTIYDDLGRVVEVGEKTENDEIANQTLGVFYFRDVFGSEVSGHYNPRVIDNDKLLAWVGGNGARNEMTRSYYDEFKTNFYNPTGITINQDNHPDCYFLSPSSLVEGQENMHRGQCLYLQLQ